MDGRFWKTEKRIASAAQTHIERRSWTDRRNKRIKKAGLLKPGFWNDVAAGEGNRSDASCERYYLAVLTAAFFAVLTFFEIVSDVFSNEPLASWPRASVVFSVTPKTSWLVA